MLSSCHVYSSILTPKIEKGVLDLRGWNFDTQGNAALNGEWEFYWHKLLPADSFTSALYPPTPHLIPVPSVWNNKLIDSIPIGGHGYATYRLKIMLDHTRPMAIHLGTIATAATVFVDQKKIYESGQLGTDQETSIPAYAPNIVWFKPDHSTFNLVIQVSNFHYRKGGIWNLIKLGKPAHIKEEWYKANGIDFFLLGSILLMSIYHMTLFLFRKKSSSALYFSLFCMMIAVRVASTDNDLLIHFISLPWNWLVRLEFISFFLAVSIFIQFFSSLFEGVFPVLLRRFMWLVSIMFSLTAIFTTPNTFSYLSPPYQILGLMVCAYIFYLSIKARKQKLPGSLVFIIGYAFLLTAFLNDVLYANDYLGSGYVISFGLLVFIICQSIILSKRFSLAFLAQERLTAAMIEKNLKIEEQNVALKQLNDELDIFVYRTSHDLRAPISSVLGLIQLMRMEKDTSNFEKYMDLQEKSLHKLDGFIQDILHYSRNTRLELELEEIDFDKMVEETFSLYGHLEQFPKIKRLVHIDQQDTFVSDTRRLTIIFNNLISNALRYYDPQKEEPFVSVNIKVNLAEVKITISDNGRGIGKEHHEKIFKMFYRAAHDAKGSGLGLFLVKETITKLGGTVALTSEPQQGTTFELTIPNQHS